MNPDADAPRAPDAAAIEDLVFTFLETCESTSSDPSEVLETLCREHPEAEAKLRATVETLAGSGLALSEGSEGESLPSVGDYRLVDRLGAGGMG